MAGSRILAVRRGALGDFILTLPALRALRESRPGAVLELLTLPAYGRLAQHFGFADSWRSVESGPAAALFCAGAAVAEDWREWLAGFDEIVSWLPDRDGVFQKQLAACGTAEFCQAPWRADGPGPAARQFGNTAGLHPAAHVLLPFPFPASAPERKKSSIMGLHPGSGSSRKNWSFDRWLKWMSLVQEAQPATRWLVVTGEAEEQQLPEMRTALEAVGLPWEAVHGLELIPLAERLRECAGFCGHDSGISHLAAACGVPCRLLFGPTDPAVWAPAAEYVRVLRAENCDLSRLSVPETAAWFLGITEMD